MLHHCQVSGREFPTNTPFAQISTLSYLTHFLYNNEINFTVYFIQPETNDLQKKMPFTPVTKKLSMEYLFL
jgi:hypothetical protein